jgi:hypothetical protein
VNRSHLADKALEVVLKIAGYGKGIQLLRQLGFVQYCEHIQKSPEWAKLGGTILTALR